MALAVSTSATLVLPSKATGQHKASLGCWLLLPAELNRMNNAVLIEC